MLDFVCLICGKMKGDKMYNESLSKIVFALVTVMWLKMKMKYEDILINLSQILVITNKNQLNLNIYASSCPHPHIQITPCLYHLL